MVKYFGLGVIGEENRWRDSAMRGYLILAQLADVTINDCVGKRGFAHFELELGNENTLNQVVNIFSKITDNISYSLYNRYC